VSGWHAPERAADVLGQLERLLVSPGDDGFNYQRMEGDR
jgi:hypothetical protein